MTHVLIVSMHVERGQSGVLVTKSTFVEVILVVALVTVLLVELSACVSGGRACCAVDVKH